MIILSQLTSLPSNFQPGAADDSLAVFPWDDVPGFRRDAVAPQAGPSTTPQRLGQERKTRTRSKNPSENAYPVIADEQSLDEHTDDDSDYNPEEPQGGSVQRGNNPRSRSQSRSRPQSQPRTPAQSRSQSRAREPSLAVGKRYICEAEGCGKAFSKPAKLKEHALSHTGERPFTCSHPGCSCSYTRLNHLQRHLLTHKDPESKEFGCSECGKRFWTREKLIRHEGLHRDDRGVAEGDAGGPIGKGKRFDCPHCSSTFHKHTKLRAHVLDQHREALLSETRASTPKRVIKKRQTPAPSENASGEESDGDLIRAEDEPRFRPFKCLVSGCGWDFETAQRLKVHARVHQAKRYICSHQDHVNDLPSFSRWSDLQNHIKTDHPPVCPYHTCHGRVFKSSKNLREHVKVHIDRGDILGPVHKRSASPPRRTVRASSEPSNETRGRKRDRHPDSDYEDEPERGKRLKRTESDVGKDWLCNEPECDKQFKTKRALAVHHSTAHLGLRPFACPHVECGNTYGHKHLLQRHIAARHRESSLVPDSTGPVADLPKFLAVPTTKVEPTGGSLLTGMHALQKMANKALACPCASVEIGHETERCQQRFGRVYDVKRHVRKVHGLELSESEVRLMLGDAEDTEVGTGA